MLSILWRKPDGAEVVFAAEQIERTCHKEAQVPASGSFIVRGVCIDSVPGNEFSFEIEKPFGAVFVMNADGKTVARYMAS